MFTQERQLLSTARANLASARSDAKGPRNDEAIHKAIMAVGEVEQALEGVADVVELLAKAYVLDDEASLEILARTLDDTKGATSASRSD